MPDTDPNAIQGRKFNLETEAQFHDFLKNSKPDNTVIFSGGGMGSLSTAAALLKEGFAVAIADKKPVFDNPSTVSFKQEFLDGLDKHSPDGKMVEYLVKHNYLTLVTQTVGKKDQGFQVETHAPLSSTAGTNPSEISQPAVASGHIRHIEEGMWNYCIEHGAKTIHAAVDLKGREKKASFSPTLTLLGQDKGKDPVKITEEISIGLGEGAHSPNLKYLQETSVLEKRKLLKSSDFKFKYGKVILETPERLQVLTYHGTSQSKPNGFFHLTPLEGQPGVTARLLASVPTKDNKPTDARIATVITTFRSDEPNPAKFIDSTRADSQTIFGKAGVQVDFSPKQEVYASEVVSPNVNLANKPIKRNAFAVADVIAPGTATGGTMIPLHARYGNDAIVEMMTDLRRLNSSVDAANQPARDAERKFIEHRFRKAMLDIYEPRHTVPAAILTNSKIYPEQTLSNIKTLYAESRNILAEKMVHSTRRFAPYAGATTQSRLVASRG